MNVQKKFGSFQYATSRQQFDPKKYYDHLYAMIPTLNTVEKSTIKQETSSLNTIDYEYPSDTLTMSTTDNDDDDDDKKPIKKVRFSKIVYNCHGDAKKSSPLKENTTNQKGKLETISKRWKNVKRRFHGIKKSKGKKIVLCKIQNKMIEVEKNDLTNYKKPIILNKKSKTTTNIMDIGTFIKVDIEKIISNDNTPVISSTDTGEHDVKSDSKIDPDAIAEQGVLFVPEVDPFADQKDIYFS